MCNRNRILPSFRALAAVAASIAFLTGLTGCAASKALKQPEKKDLSVLAAGTPRGSVVGEFGKPYLSETQGGKDVDYFAFTQGYAETTKIARATLHGTASVVTLGLWEVFGNPTESYFDGTEVQLKVAYDRSGRVEAVEALKGEEVIEGVEIAAAKNDPSAATFRRVDDVPPATKAPAPKAAAPPVSKSVASAAPVSARCRMSQIVIHQGSMAVNPSSSSRSYWSRCCCLRSR